MSTMNELLNKRTDQIKSQLSGAIQSQMDELDIAKGTVVNYLLGINSSRFSIREQFTYLAKVQETLNSMLNVYRELFGEEYRPEPKETTTL